MTLTIDAEFVRNRTLPVWRIQLIDETGKCQHLVERFDRTDAERLARRWAAERGAIIAFQSGCFCYCGPAEKITVATDSRGEP